MSASVRRGEATDAAIRLLASQGSRGLTHREVDRHLGWPFGSTSNYFRRRNDVFVAIAERIMQLDLADIDAFEKELAQSEEVDIDLVADLITMVIEKWLTPANRSRAYARSEILFESIRNAELRLTTRVQIAKVELTLRRVFQLLGSPAPATSAGLFSLLMSSLHISAQVAKRALKAHQLRAIVRSSLVISVEQTNDSEPG